MQKCSESQRESQTARSTSTQSGTDSYNLNRVTMVSTPRAAIPLMINDQEPRLARRDSLSQLSEKKFLHCLGRQENPAARGNSSAGERTGWELTQRLNRHGMLHLR